MIKYSLACDSDHTFDSWFASIAAFETLRDNGQVICPHCGSSRVDRAPMAPAVASSRQLEKRQNVHAGGPPAATPDMRAALELVRQFKSQVLESTEDVGVRFAEEARKMHFGEAEQRGIRGQATSDEARELKDDGVEFGVLPDLPEDHN